MAVAGLTSLAGAPRRTMASGIAGVAQWRPLDGAANPPPGLTMAHGRLANTGTGNQSWQLGPWQLAAFTGVGARWQATGQARLRLQLQDPQGDWGAWQDLPPSSHLEDRSGAVASDVLLGAGIAVRLTLELGPGNVDPAAIWDLEITAIDATAGPLAPASGSIVPLNLGDRPTIVGRASWGCPEPYSSPAWPPVYRTVQKIMVHHTATSSSLDGAQAVRTIYTYHAVSQGWGDIGYNFLVDSGGNIYEGRYGGDDVIAGHALCYNPGSLGVAVIGSFDAAAPSPAAELALVNLLAWKCRQRSIDPAGASFFVDRMMMNICSHRDANGGCTINTECPGSALYGRLPPLRDAVAGRTGSVADREIGERFERHNTPWGLGTGDVATVRVDVTNIGSMTWTTSGSGWVRLGYKWFRANGTQYVQAPEEDWRTTIPRVVRYGELAAIDAGLVAPREAGTYRLRWDLEQPNVRWFESEPKNQPLDVPVLVRAPSLAVSADEVVLLASPGLNSAPVTVSVLNAGWGQLAWTARPTAASDAWLEVSPEGASAPGLLEVRAISRGLAPGVYHGAVTVTANVPGVQVESSPQTIAVRLVVADPPYRAFAPVVVE